MAMTASSGRNALRWPSAYCEPLTTHPAEHLAYIIDGTVAVDLTEWTDNHLGVLPLSHDLHGQPLCPACAAAGYIGLLSLVTSSRRYTCPRRHLFALGADRTRHPPVAPPIDAGA
jgi:hypothetical protein